VQGKLSTGVAPPPLSSRTGRSKQAQKQDQANFHFPLRTQVQEQDLEMLPKGLLPKLVKWCQEAEPDLGPRLAVPGPDQDPDRDAVITLDRRCHLAAGISATGKTQTPASVLVSLGSAFIPQSGNLRPSLASLDPWRR